jgi:hypothetical protein
MAPQRETEVNASARHGRIRPVNGRVATRFKNLVRLIAVTQKRSGVERGWLLEADDKSGTQEEEAAPGVFLTR